MLVNKLRAEARCGDEDSDYVTAIDEIYNGIREWIESGFGRGREGWASNALRTMRVDRNSGPFTASELNRIRVEISKRYCSLDDFFHVRFQRLWTEIASLLEQHLGDLLEGKQGVEALRSFSMVLEEASEPCPALSDAVHNLLDLQVQYRTNLHPRVRQELDILNLQVIDTETNAPVDQIVVTVSETGAEELFKGLAQLATQAAYRTKNALVRDALIPALILHAAAEQFEDSLIRSGDSEREFKRIARSYRDEIWPGQFEGLSRTNAHLAKLSRAIRTVRATLGEIERGNA